MLRRQVPQYFLKPLLPGLQADLADTFTTAGFRGRNPAVVSQLKVEKICRINKSILYNAIQSCGQLSGRRYFERTEV